MSVARFYKFLVIFSYINQRGFCSLAAEGKWKLDSQVDHSLNSSCWNIPGGGGGGYGCLIVGEGGEKGCVWDGGVSIKAKNSLAETPHCFLQQLTPPPYLPNTYTHSHLDPRPPVSSVLHPQGLNHVMDVRSCLLHKLFVLTQQRWVAGSRQCDFSWRKNDTTDDCVCFSHAAHKLAKSNVSSKMLLWFISSTAFPRQHMDEFCEKN